MSSPQRELRRNSHSELPVLAALTDADLFRRFLEGENGPYTTLYHRYSARVLGYIRSLLGADSHAAHDVFQETFIRLYRERERILDLDDRERRLLTNVGGWLFRVARNLSLNQLRSEGFLAPLPDDSRTFLVTRPEDAFSNLFGEHLEEEALLRRVRELVETMPMSLREVFMLREVNGLTYEEVSRVTGCSTEAARMRLSRARSFLRKALTAPATEKQSKADRN